VAFLGRVGADERGKRLVAQLKAEGVDVQAVSIDPTTETGVALIMVEAGGEKQIMTAPGANHRLSAAEVMEASPLLARARVVLLQLELAPAATDAAARLARAAGARVVLDSAPPRALAEELLRDVHLVRANAAEAEVLTGLAIANRSTARAAAQNLLRRGVSAAVIGAPGGDLLLDEGGDLWVPHISVPAVDATGAGDAFSATLAVGLARGDDLRAVMRRASAAAALKTMKFGARAGLPTSTELEAFVHWAHSAENVVRAQ
jgi:ribokinase